MSRKQIIQNDDDLLAADLREAFGITNGAAQEFANSEARRRQSRDGSGARYYTSGPCTFGTNLGDFKILSELGRGGMGVVYRAHQLSLNREVALKVLPGYSQRGARAIQRFLLEAQAAARLHHTNIVPVYAQGESDGHFYYAMEMILGGSLDSAIRERSRFLSPSNIHLSDDPIILDRSLGLGDSSSAEAMADDQALSLPTVTRDVMSLHRKREDFQHLARLLSEVADGLEHAHQAGVIHRDIKPLNLLVDQKGRLHITDFGLARLTGSPTLTMSGEVLGTPAYLSPEQVDPTAGEIDHRTDIYSLGVTLYELLTLHRPFEGETREQIITGIRHIPPRPPKQFDPNIPKDLQTICLKALEKDKAQRYRSAACLGDDLLRFSEGRPILSRPPNLAVRAGKWARRHKAASTAIVALALVVSLGAGLAASVVSARRNQADKLLADAYNILVYREPRYFEVEAERIALAERLGGDPAMVAFLRALGAFSEDMVDDQIRLLEMAIKEDPLPAAPYYLLAAGYERNNQPNNADELLAIAPMPVTAADWYFKGLALHRTNTVEAISCYAKARDLVKEDTGEPFLQGSLQLARALNQRLFAERDLELFYQARDVLSSLNNFEMYDARVNYLQSIAHRIAGEITAGNTGTRLGDSENYFQLALEYARKAQEDRPDHTDSYLAEAHCLEMMGDLDGAIVARTQAVTVARTEAVTAAGIDKQRLLEALHFRWRLYYWTGQYAAALDDIYELQAGLEGTPLHLIYAHVYPAWVLAEMGDDGGAVELAQSIVPDSSDAPVAARRIIWAATTLRLIGHADLADELIAACDSRVSFDAELLPWQTPEWMQTLYEMVGGAEDLEALLELIDKARAAGMAQPWRLSGEAYFHDAVIRLADGRRNEALDGFATAHRSFDSIQSYMFHAQIIKKRMSDNPQWPLWLPADALEFDDPSRVQRR